MADMTQPKELLTEALAAVESLASVQSEWEAASGEAGQQESGLQTLQKRMEKEKEQTLEARRGEVAEGFDQQIREVEAEIKSVSDARGKARSEGVSARIEAQTAPMKEIGKKLEQEMKELYRANGVPAFCRSKLYFLLFMPRSIAEILILLACFLLVFLGLPFLLYYYVIPGEAFWHWLIIYPFVILIFGGPYIAVANATKGKYMETLRAGRKLRTKIRDNERAVRRMKRSIRKDPDDTLYNLQDFDEELQQKNSARALLMQQKEEALLHFDTETKAALLAEIDSRYQAELADLSAKLSALRTKEAAAKMNLDAGRQQINVQFVPLIGAKNMDRDRLLRMRAMLDAGEASTIAEAADKL